MRDSEIHQKKIPKSRFSRLSSLGSLVGKVAGNVALESCKRLVTGEKVGAKQLILTPKNALHLTEHLAQMRGAAMKMGQLLSMDAGELLPQELTDILSRLRSSGASMPLPALNKTLENEWGKQWRSQFKHFSYQPIAAASIGQVHRAVLHDSTLLAIKIQYPGIRQSIDGDVDNLASLLSMSRLIPKTVNLNELLDETKAQLHSEADYLQEAQFLISYQSHLKNDPRFLIPNLYKDLCTDSILAMDYVEGEPIESQVNQPQALRDRIISSLFELMFREMFDFRLVQTDPNFANYLYNDATGQIVLLDFGATREYSQTISSGYQQLMMSAIKDDSKKMLEAAESIGFFQEDIMPEQKQTVIELIHQGCEPLYEDGPYDFASSDLAQRIKDKGLSLSMQQNYWHTPPVDALFFHRKLGGLYLLATHLRARVNLQSVFKKVVEQL